MENVINIEDKRDGPWFALQDPVTKNAHVIPHALINNWVNGSVEISEPEHFEAIRAILRDYLEGLLII